MKAKGPTRATMTDAGRFYARLRALGCEYCPRCRCYMYPDHSTHMGFSTPDKVFSAPPTTLVLAGELEAVA